MSVHNNVANVIPPLSPMLSLPPALSSTSETPPADARNRKVLAATFALDFCLETSTTTTDPLKLYQSMRGFLCAYLVFPLLALSSSACDAVFTGAPPHDLDVADVLKPRLALINDTVFRIYYAVQSAAREPLATLTRIVCLLLNKCYPGEERDVQANSDPVRDACLQHLLEYFGFHSDVVRLARDLRWLRASFLSNFPTKPSNATTRDTTLHAVLHSFAPALFGPYAYNRVVVSQTFSLEGYLLAIVVPVLAHSRAAADPNNNTVLDTFYEPPISFLDIDAIAAKLISLDQQAVMTKQNRIDLAAFLSQGSSPAYYDPSPSASIPIPRLPASLYNHVLGPVVAAILEHLAASFVQPILVYNHNRARALADDDDASYDAAATPADPDDTESDSD